MKSAREVQRLDRCLLEWQSRVTAAVDLAVAGAPEMTRRLAEALAANASVTTTAQPSVVGLGLSVPTTESRFLRAGAPTPKRVLLALRLALACALLREGFKSADVAYALHFPYPQGLTRFVKRETGRTTQEFAKVGLPQDWLDSAGQLLRMWHAVDVAPPRRVAA